MNIKKEAAELATEMVSSACHGCFAEIGGTDEDKGKLLAAAYKAVNSAVLESLKDISAREDEQQ